MKARLHHIEPVADGVVTFWLTPERPLHYLAGQYVEIFLPHDNPDSRGEHRWFSLSSSPTEPLLGITAKFEQTNGSSFKQALRSLRPGAVFTLSDPLGDFVVPKDPTIPLVFIAAGIGITPIRSIVQWLTDKQDERQVQLVYITPKSADMLFLPLFQAYPGLLLIPLHTREALQDKLSAAGILGRIGKPDEKLIYLSGPQPLIEDLWESLQQLGITRDQLVLDYFPGYNTL
jgi:ferredoxin-NADP reductase